MTRSEAHLGRSPHLRSRGALFALFVGGVAVLAAPSAFAKKKSGPATPAEDSEKPGDAKSDTPSAQATDTEKPKRILDTSQEAPKTDSLGHVHFGSPNAEGIGRVAVKAAPDQKIKVYLEGRYFGTAPLTIYSVPKGDYIVEATYPNGKQDARPVTVGDNEETVVDFGEARPIEHTSGGALAAEMTPTRMLVTEIGLVAAGVGLVAAVTFGILELKAESDYKSATNQMQRDDITNRGNRMALLTNVGIAVGAAGLFTAAIAGYPLVFRSTEKKVSLAVTPVWAPGVSGGSLTLRF